MSRKPPGQVCTCTVFKLGTQHSPIQEAEWRARPGRGLGGWTQGLRAHACSDVQLGLHGPHSPVQGPEVQMSPDPSTPLCLHNVWAPLISARHPTPSRASLHSGPHSSSSLFLPGGPPFRSHLAGRLHGCKVETEASGSLWPPPPPARSHTLHRRPAFACTPSPAGRQEPTWLWPWPPPPPPPPRPPSRRAEPDRWLHCGRRRRSERPGPPPAEIAERIRAARTKRGQGGAWGCLNASGKSHTYPRGTGL